MVPAGSALNCVRTRAAPVGGVGIILHSRRVVARTPSEPLRNTPALDIDEVQKEREWPTRVFMLFNPLPAPNIAKFVESNSSFQIPAFFACADPLRSRLPARISIGIPRSRDVPPHKQSDPQRPIQNSTLQHDGYNGTDTQSARHLPVTGFVCFPSTRYTSPAHFLILHASP